MLKKLLSIILVIMLVFPFVFAEELPVRTDSKGNDYQGCIVQLKQKPVLDITADKEQKLKSLDAQQDVLEENLNTALKQKSKASVSRLTKDIATVMKEEKAVVSEEKNAVESHMNTLVAEHQSFLQSLQAAPLPPSSESSFSGLTGMASLKPGVVKEELFLGINGFLLDVDEQQCNALKNSPLVSGAVLNRMEFAALRESVPLMCDNRQAADNSCTVWSLKDSADKELTGKGVIVAVIDTGIDYTHPDFGSCTAAQVTDGNDATCPKVLGGWDFFNVDNDPMDSDSCTSKEITDSKCPDQAKKYGGHGTHVASTIAGKGKAAGGIDGVAPDAQLLIFKTLGGATGGGSSLNRIKALACSTGVIGNVADILQRFGTSISVQEMNACSKKAHIVSLSLAGSDVFTYDPAKCDLDGATFADGETYNCPVDRAVKNGVVAVIAAGNAGRSGDHTVKQPGTSVKAITVGNSCDGNHGFGVAATCQAGDTSPQCIGFCTATDWKTRAVIDGIAPSSSRGPTPEGRMKPDVVAPGTWITAAWPSSVDRSKCQNLNDGNPLHTDSKYCTISGTSMATPHVSGVVALMLQKNNALKPEEVKDILMKTAKNLGGADYAIKSGTTFTPNTAAYEADSTNWQDGAGRVDVRAAVDLVPASQPAGGGTGGGIACTPVAEDICNGKDDDCNKVVDDGRETKETKCTDTIDNDCDGKIDADDSDCQSAGGTPTGTPDIIIAAISVTPETGTAIPVDLTKTPPTVEITTDKAISMDITVKNKGDGDAGAFKLELDKQTEKEVKSFTGLAKGASVITSYTLSFSGAKTITIKADSDNTVAEGTAGENNNQVSVQITITPPTTTTQPGSGALPVLVPSWASKWAALPKGVELPQLVNGKFSGVGDLTVKISGFDLVWSKGYRTDVKYVLSTLQAGQQLDASKVWLPFDVSTKKPDNSLHTVDKGWIVLTPADVLITTIQPSTFELNDKRYNAVALFACKLVGPKEGFVEYDCNGIDGKPVQVKKDSSITEQSSKGSWLLSDFELGGLLLPPPPGLPGT